MKLAYTSEAKIYMLDNGSKTEIPCGRLIKYKETLESIRRRSEWKTTGKGAQFTGAAAVPEDISEVATKITGLSYDGEKLIYGVILDQSAALYNRSTDRTDDNEGLILSGNEFTFGAFDSLDGKLAVSMGSSRSELHINVMEPPSSAYTEYTDGDTVEENPWWSRSRRGKIYFSTAGNARNEYGAVGAVSPRSGAVLDIEAGTMDEILSDEKYDYLKIKDDSAGNIYYIRQVYGGEKPSDNTSILDILLFPVKILKALGGWLNFMCTIWGGDPLKKGDTGLPGFAKSKNRSAKDIIIDGNVIKAEKLARENELKDDASSIMPLSRVLIKREADGEETVIKKGVLDYTVCSDGKLIISDGRRISVIEDGKETQLAKAYLAVNLTPVEG